MLWINLDPICPKGPVIINLDIKPKYPRKHFINIQSFTAFKYPPGLHEKRSLLSNNRSISNRSV